MSSLLQLPQELRDAIYAYAVVEDETELAPLETHIGFLGGQKSTRRPSMLKSFLCANTINKFRLPARHLRCQQAALPRSHFGLDEEPQIHPSEQGKRDVHVKLAHRR